MSEGNLMVQLDVFEDGLESDSKEARNMGLEITTVFEEDPLKLFATLKGNKLTLFVSLLFKLFADLAFESPYKEAFLQTLRFLLDFSVEAGTGPKIWNMYL